MEEQARFKIQGVGLDTTNLDFSPDASTNRFSYIHTNLSSNNDFLIRDYISKLTENSTNFNLPIIVTADFLDGLEISLIGHLSELYRDCADLLLINPKCDIDKYQEMLVKLYDSKIVKEIGISLPESKAELETIVTKLNCLGINAGYVSLNICPFNFDPEIVKYCRDNDILIVGFNPFGGHLTAPLLIDSFTVPYLLEFSAYYSDIVCLSSRDLYNSITDRDYLSTLIGTTTGSEYELNKSISKLVQPIKKTVYTGLRFSDGSLMPYDKPTLTYNSEVLKLSFGKSFLPEIKQHNPVPDTIEEDVYNLFKSFHRPEDGTDDDFFSIIRHQIKKLFFTRFNSEEGWSMYCANIGGKIILYNLEKTTYIDGGWFKKDKVEKEEHTYLLYYFNGTFLFKEILDDDIDFSENTIPEIIKTENESSEDLSNEEENTKQ